MNPKADKYRTGKSKTTKLEKPLFISSKWTRRELFVKILQKHKPQI